MELTGDRATASVGLLGKSLSHGGAPPPKRSERKSISKPDVKVLATEPTIKKNQATLPTKLSFWPPRMGANAPKNVPVPELLSGNTITLEGQTLEIRGLEDKLAHRSYMWIPSIKAVVGASTCSPDCTFTAAACRTRRRSPTSRQATD